MYAILRNVPHIDDGQHMVAGYSAEPKETYSNSRLL